MKVTLNRIAIKDFSGYSYLKDMPAKLHKAQKIAEMLNIALPEQESPDYSEKKPDDYIHWNIGVSDEAVVDNATLLMLIQERIAFDYRQKLVTEIDPAELFKEMAEKNELQLTLQESGAGNVYNNKCDVHMPGNMLASYNEVQLLEDSCSDVLQSSLSSGWHLIAVCPQPDQRRPDYILGRFNPGKEINDDASRGK